MSSKKRQPQSMRVARVDLDRDVVGDYNANYVLAEHAREGFRHGSTVATPDGRYAVVTLVQDDARPAQYIRVARLDLDTNNIGDFDADYILDGHTRDGFYHAATAATPDGRYAVLTLASDEDPGD